MNESTYAKLIAVVAVIVFIAGGFGMLFCFPFLWSAKINNLMGAGFPFVAGAILVGSSLMALSQLQKNK